MDRTVRCRRDRLARVRDRRLVDRFLTWRRDLKIKAAAGQDVSVELVGGSLIVREAASRAGHIGAGRRDRTRLLEPADMLQDSTPIEDRVRLAVHGWPAAQRLAHP